MTSRCLFNRFNLSRSFSLLGNNFKVFTMPGNLSITSFFKPVASKRSISDVTGGKGDLDESLKKVSSDPGIMRKIKDMSDKLSALHSNIGETWFLALEPEFQKEYFKKLSTFLTEERSNGTVFPPLDRVWSWTRMCPIAEVKVVILGQDPYHGPEQAHGLSFSVPKGVMPPPSLKNMYKELESDIPGFKTPNHGLLEGWAEQGVLLLNACLTVRCHAANSHKDKGWETLTDSVIRYISKHSKGVVFLLWGAYAQKKAAIVDSSKHHLLKTVHPSPLSVHRGFFGCKHFSKCNEFLVKQGKKPIDWTRLP